MKRFFNIMRSLGFHRGPERLVAGIAGGISRKFGVPVASVRILMLLAFLIPGVGLGTYLVLWAITPNSTGGIPLERFLDGYHRRV